MPHSATCRRRPGLLEFSTIAGRFAVAAIVALLSSAATAAEAEPDRADFEHRVQPLFAAKLLRLPR